MIVSSLHLYAGVFVCALLVNVHAPGDTREKITSSGSLAAAVIVAVVVILVLLVVIVFRERRIKRHQITADITKKKKKKKKKKKLTPGGTESINSNNTILLCTRSYPVMNVRSQASSAYEDTTEKCQAESPVSDGKPTLCKLNCDSMCRARTLNLNLDSLSTPAMKSPTYVFDNSWPPTHSGPEGEYHLESLK